MPDTEANPASTDAEALLAIKKSVQERISRISRYPGTTGDKATSALRMNAWLDLLTEFDRKLISFENAA